MLLVAALCLVESRLSTAHLSPRSAPLSNNLNLDRQADCPESLLNKCLMVAPQLKWTVKSSVDSAITAGNGRLYFINKEADGSYLVTLDGENGRLKWRQRLASTKVSQPVAADELVCVGTDNGILYAFDGNTGVQKWSFNAGYDLTEATPAYAQNLLVLSDGPTVYALDARTGNRSWKLEISARKTAAIKIVEEVVYLTAGGRGHGAVWALDLRSGKARWAIRTGEISYQLAASPKIVCFFDWFELRVVDANTGADKWRQRVSDALSASLQVSGDLVYLRSDSDLSAFSGDSPSLKWELRNLGRSNLLFAAGDNVYLCERNYLIAVNSKTGARRWTFVAKGEGAAMAVNDDALAFVDRKGWIYSARLLRFEFSMHGGQPLEAPRTFERADTLLATLETDVDTENIKLVVSPDAQRVALVTQSQAGYWKQAENVVVGDANSDAVTGQEFFLVFTPVFGPDYTQLAYRVLGRGSYSAGSKAQIIVAEKREILWERASEQYGFAYDPVFSPDGARMAYKASDTAFEQIGRVGGGPWFMVLNGTRKEPFDIISAPVFSPDSKHLAYLAGRGRAITTSGVDGTGQISQALVHADKWLIVLDDIKQPEYDWVGEPVFNPDSSKVAYAVRSGNGYFIFNGEKKESCPGQADELQFTPDGKTLAYIVERDEKMFVVAGSKKGKTFRWANSLTFSRDGKRLAYGAGTEENKWVVVVSSATLTETKVGKAYDLVSGPVFSPDGKLIAYQAKRGDGQIVVFGEREGNVYEETGPPVFNMQSTKVAYRARRGRSWFLVVGTQEIASYDYLTDPVFSPDGTKIGCGVKSGKQLLWKVIPAPVSAHE